MAGTNLKAVLRMTGLTADTVRAWERRYGAVQPVRTPTGRRTYSELEVNRLKLLSDLVRQGFAIGEIAKKEDSELLELLARARAPLPSAGASVEALLAAVRNFDLPQLQREFARLRFAMSPREFAFHLIPQVMIQVGVEIDRGRFDIAQEHALSDLVRHFLRSLYDDLEPLDGSRPGGVPRMVFAAPEGQFHDLGLILAAIACRFRATACHFLGANLPAASLASAASDLKAGTVILSLAALPEEDRKVEPHDYVLELDRKLPKGVAIWLGGSAASQVKRKQIARELFVFERIEDLEAKLQSILPAIR